MYIVFHLNILYKMFLSDTFNENPMKNINEIHFVMNINNGRTLNI